MVLCKRFLFRSCVVNGHLIIHVHCGESSRWTGSKWRGRYDWPDSQGHQAVLMTRTFVAIEGYPSFCTVCAGLVQHEVIDPESMTCENGNVNDILKSIMYLHITVWKFLRSKWPNGLRRGSAATHFLGSRVRIPSEKWMSLSCEYCVLLGRGLCVGPITRPEEF